jgi:hypothetical protein
MKYLFLIIIFLLLGCKSFDPNDLLDPTSTIIKKLMEEKNNGN